MNQPLEINNLKGLIFDYGGTIDTGGNHWGRVLWHAYEQLGVAVSHDSFKEAYVYAERWLATHPVIDPSHTFRQTLESKLSIELKYLTDNNLWAATTDERLQTAQRLLENLYTGVQKAVDGSRRVLLQLAETYPLVLVSNFYGNIHTVLREFQLDTLFGQVIESAVVGVRKPDPRIFTLGVEALKLQPEETLVVGDSYRKDILPAAAAGCHSAWIKGEQWEDEPFDESVPDMIISNLNELLTLITTNK